MKYPNLRSATALSAVLALSLLASTVAMAQIKYVFSLDYPLGEKDNYLRWVVSIADQLQSADQVQSISSYDNYFGSSPHRFIEFEFATLEDAAAYMERVDIRAVFLDVVNHGINSDLEVYKRRSDYQADMSAPRGAVKYMFLVNYPVGGKDDYLAWVGSVAEALQAPPEVTRISSYDNYFGSRPNRLIEFEFASAIDAGRYFSRPEIEDILDRVGQKGEGYDLHVLSLRGDYARRP